MSKVFCNGRGTGNAGNDGGIFAIAEVLANGGRGTGKWQQRYWQMADMLAIAELLANSRGALAMAEEIVEVLATIEQMPRCFCSGRGTGTGGGGFCKGGTGRAKGKQ